jgi:hypothetical protein
LEVTGRGDGDVSIEVNSGLHGFVQVLRVCGKGKEENAMNSDLRVV